MKKRFTEQQIVRILKEAEDGMAAIDVCRKHNISEQTFYRWKSKYGGMEVSEVKRLKALEKENEELLTIDLTVVLEFGVRIPDICVQLQSAVKEAVEEMTGQQVYAVNVVVQGIRNSGEKAEGQQP